MNRCLERPCRKMEHMRGRWTVGLCAHCEEELDPVAPALFCSARCKTVSKDVRYFRRCYRDGRAWDEDVMAALNKRMAFHVAGGYDARARRLSAEVRHEVLAANRGLCCACNERVAVEVDHIDGPSPERSNLQGLCKECHDAKTQERMVPMNDKDRACRDEFLELVWSEPPVMAAHDELAWGTEWRRLLKETREWAQDEVDALDAGSFGDGATGTEDDFEHGAYLLMLSERDD